jgi:phage terminase large subunit-like protein
LTSHHSLKKSMRCSSAFLAKLKLLTPDLIAAERRRRSQRRMDQFFPTTGPLRRELYPKHLEFFRAGREHRERLFMAGNRCGKTVAGAYELTLHLTGLYPDWWEGRRFDGAIYAWAAGETARTVRDIVQHELLGPSDAWGTGMIPGDMIVRVTRSRGTADAADSVYVKHVRGGRSSLGFKSYKEGRKNFQGTSRHVIWFDEEPDIAVYTEALMRTMKVPGTEEGGLTLVTFTPLQGYTEVVESFLGAARDNAPVASTP